MRKYELDPNFVYKSTEWVSVFKNYKLLKIINNKSFNQTTTSNGITSSTTIYNYYLLILLVLQTGHFLSTENTI